MNYFVGANNQWGVALKHQERNKGLFLSRIVTYICMVPDREVIIIYHYAELILEKVVYDILVLCFGIKFSMQISIQMLVTLYSLEI